MGGAGDKLMVLRLRQHRERPASERSALPVSQRWDAGDPKGRQIERLPQKNQDLGLYLNGGAHAYRAGGSGFHP